MTSEQLEAARTERMRQNGLGTLTLEDARTWIEETGLCLFLPKRQFTSSVAPSFVEAVCGRQELNPDSKQVALAEDLLVRLESEGVAVRLNLVGTPGEQPDFIVAGWVLPYVYALRGDRDWRRSPQLTGSRQVSQLAVLAYKQLEAGDASISQLKQALGREVSEAAVLRAITELWQQLRIIPVVSAPGHAAKWQLLRTRFQRAIAEGASTSQVTAISVLASIYLQAVIAATMEEVELFLAPLTARSKIREVLRGLVATRQVHTISLGHAPHFYVAGTLPEFAPQTTLYASASMPASAYFTRSFDREDDMPAPTISVPVSTNGRAYDSHEADKSRALQRTGLNREKETSHQDFGHSAHTNRDRKMSAAPRLGQASQNGRPVRRSVEARTQGPRKRGAVRPGSASRWSQNAQKSSGGNGKSIGSRSGIRPGTATRPTGRASNGNHRSQSAKSTGTAWSKLASAKRNSHASPTKAASKPENAARKGGIARKDSSRPAHGTRKPLATAGAMSKRFEFSARTKQASKKRG